AKSTSYEIESSSGPGTVIQSSVPLGVGTWTRSLSFPRACRYTRYPFAASAEELCALDSRADTRIPERLSKSSNGLSACSPNDTRTSGCGPSENFGAMRPSLRTSWLREVRGKNGLVFSCDTDAALSGDELRIERSSLESGCENRALSD